MFFKITGNTCGKTKGTILKEKTVKDLFDDAYATCFLIFFTKAYVVITHLNCIHFCNF